MEFPKNSHIHLKFNSNDIYFAQNNIILDKVCPNCGKLIFKETEFCSCGFFLKAAKDSAFWGKILSIWLIIGIIFLVVLINTEKIQDFTIAKLNNKNLNFNSLAPVNIQIIAAMKNTPYQEYIQNVYARPDKTNELVVLVKPSLWNILASNQKTELLKTVKIHWESIYKATYPDSGKKAQVSFGNT